METETDKKIKDVKTTNIKIPIWRRLYDLKLNKEFLSLSDTIEYLLDKEKNGKEN